MNRSELDSFVAEVGTTCNTGGEDKWRGMKTESHITQKVRQLSKHTSQTAMSAVKTASSSTMTKGSADANANCREAR